MFDNGLFTNEVYIDYETRKKQAQAAKRKVNPEGGNVNIVIDNGSGFIKAGFAGCDQYTNIFPSIVGRKNYMAGTLGTQEVIYVGDEA